MKKSLPCLLALAACTIAVAARGEPPAAPLSSQVPVAQASGGQADQLAPGDRLLVQVASQLERHASISARLRHQVSISGKPYDGVGTYCQQGSGEDLKVRFELQIAGLDAQYLQVSNSRHAWIDRTLPTGRNVSRIDLRQLKADPVVAGGDLGDIKPGEASWSALHSELISYDGGLPALLAALSENFTFLPPQAMRLALAPPLSAEPTNLPVWAVVGHWKPARLEALLPKDQSGRAGKGGSSKLPGPSERVPQEILLLVGQADFFPYRIEYRHLETPQLTTSDGNSIPYQLSVHPMVVLELSEVAFDVQVAPSQFDYTPGNADWVDQTSAILDRLRQRHQQQVATRPPTEARN